MSLIIALAGNPNCGKTTIFNSLTGSNQYVGNWPGVTVEKKEGRFKERGDVIIMDLPGIYSLSPYTVEEVVARKYLVSERPDAILNIIDGTNIERNLYLTTQLLELGIPVVVAVNMIDIIEKNGDKINIELFSKALSGCPVFPVSALKNNGINKAVLKAIELAEQPKSAPEPIRFSGKPEEALTKIYHMLGDYIPREQKRFFSIKLFERDSKINELLKDKKVPDVEDIIKKTEKALDDDSESIIISERYAYITSIIKQCYVRKSDTEETTSEKIDKILTNRFLALPIFALVMFIMYYVSVTTVGTYLTDWLSDGIFGEGFEAFGRFIPGIPTVVQAFLESVGAQEWLISLIVDGIISGVGAVLSFCAPAYGSVCIPGIFRGLRIHVSGCLYNGRGFQEIWTFGEILYTNSYRNRLRRAGDYGVQNYREPCGQENDRNHHNLYPLRRKAAYDSPVLRRYVRRCMVGGSKRIPHGNLRNCGLGNNPEKDTSVFRRPYALCYGASALSYAHPDQHLEEHLG